MWFLRFQTHVLLGMGMQAAISAALWPDGIDADQQLRASIIFGTMVLLLLVIDLVVTLNGKETPDKG